jgi:hypothetical protein
LGEYYFQGYYKVF